jgi:2,3-bisphosphoglycerate-independent phosphoglycerate mutase
MVLPDHPTPIRIRTHSIDPVPFMIYDSRKSEAGVDGFCEESAEAAGNYVENGYTLMDILVK